MCHKNVHKKCAIKRKLKFGNYKYCLKGTKLTNKIKHLQKDKIDRCSLKKDYEEFIKDNKILIKIQQRWKSEGHKVFIEKINKITLSLNDHKRM